MEIGKNVSMWKQCFLLFILSHKYKIIQVQQKSDRGCRVDMELHYINTQLSANESSQLTNAIFLNSVTVMSFKTIFATTNDGNLIKYSKKHNPKIS